MDFLGLSPIAEQCMTAHDRQDFSPVRKKLEGTFENFLHDSYAEILSQCSLISFIDFFNIQTWKREDKCYLI